MQFDGDLHNGILVMQAFLDCDRERALGVVVDLMTDRMHQFEHLVVGELPVLCEELDLDEGTRAAVDGYVQDRRNWMSAVLTWHRGTARYDEAELRFHPPVVTPSPGVPAGLGTAAARLGPGLPV